jgi:hypothetical protein
VICSQAGCLDFTHQFVFGVFAGVSSNSTSVDETIQFSFQSNPDIQFYVGSDRNYRKLSDSHNDFFFVSEPETTGPSILYPKTYFELFLGPPTSDPFIVIKMSYNCTVSHWKINPILLTGPILCIFYSEYFKSQLFFFQGHSRA